MAKRKQPPAESSNPTPERLLRSGGNFTIGDRQRILTMRDDPLGAAHHRGAITDAQFFCGQKYYLHWYRAGLAGHMGSADLGRVLGGDGAGLFASENACHHLKQFRAGHDALNKRTRDVVNKIVLDREPLISVGYGLGWNNKLQASAAATERLREGLDLLVVLWG